MIFLDNFTLLNNVKKKQVLRLQLDEKKLGKPDKINDLILKAKAYLRKRLANIQ